jgi:FkbM family methyltransferase
MNLRAAYRNFPWDILRGYADQTYSQEGEDMVLRRIFETVKKGFYVDVGALHPKRFSNTYYFYRKGWSGINIDAMPGSMISFNRVRPRDINIEAAVGMKSSALVYHVFNDPALNTFDAALARARTSGTHHVIRKHTLNVLSLTEILDRNLPNGQTIDFMTVDVEGFDLQVLQSNDWNRYRPRYLLAESDATTCAGVRDTELHRFLDEKGYEFFGKTVLTAFFKERE